MSKPISITDSMGMIKSINTFKQVSMDIYYNYFLNGDYGYLDAMLVNAAFSTEVGLKYLAGFDKQEYEKGHSWNEYWNQLNVRYKNIILIFLNKKCQNKYNWDFINNSISELANTFTDLRYSYEKSHIGMAPKFVMEFMNAISFVANYRYDNNEPNLELFEMGCIAKIMLNEEPEFIFKME